jgi:hypothetical protein
MFMKLIFTILSSYLFTALLTAQPVLTSSNIQLGLSFIC